MWFLTYEYIQLSIHNNTNIISQVSISYDTDFRYSTPLLPSHAIKYQKLAQFGDLTNFNKQNENHKSVSYRICIQVDSITDSKSAR